MNVVELATGKNYVTEVLPVEENDFKLLNKKRYFFDWKSEENHEVFKLQIAGSNDILGLISIERIPEEWRIHIRLLTGSKENKGYDKKFDHIAGNLIAHAAKIAVAAYAHYACLSFKPKSGIVQHYIEKYGMRITGMTLSIEVPEILNLINKYENEK